MQRLPHSVPGKDADAARARRIAACHSATVEIADDEAQALLAEMLDRSG